MSKFAPPTATGAYSPVDIAEPERKTTLRSQDFSHREDTLSSSVLKIKNEGSVSRNTHSSVSSIICFHPGQCFEPPGQAWSLAVAMTAVMIFELVRNAQEQGTPISTKPVFNPMIGPSQSALINFGDSMSHCQPYVLTRMQGARYPLCMKRVTEVPIDIQFGCLNNTANPPTRLCSLEDICGFGGFHGKEPNQWWRFVVIVVLLSLKTAHRSQIHHTYLYTRWLDPYPA